MFPDKPLFRWFSSIVGEVDFIGSRVIIFYVFSFLRTFSNGLFKSMIRLTKGVCILTFFLAIFIKKTQDSVKNILYSSKWNEKVKTHPLHSNENWFWNDRNLSYLNYNIKSNNKISEVDSSPLKMHPFRDFWNR